MFCADLCVLVARASAANLCILRPLHQHPFVSAHAPNETTTQSANTNTPDLVPSPFCRAGVRNQAEQKEAGCLCARVCLLLLAFGCEAALAKAETEAVRAVLRVSAFEGVRAELGVFGEVVVSEITIEKATEDAIVGLGWLLVLV